MAKSIQDILAVAEDEAYHRVVTATIAAVPQALRDEHEALVEVLPTLVSDTIDEHPERMITAERILEIEAEMEACTIEFRFRSIGHRAWADLLRAHAPTKEQLRQDRSLDHNPETFPDVAMAVSCVEPVMSVEEVKRLAASPLVDVAAWSRLWNACIKANVAAANPKSLVAAGLIRHRSESSAPLPSTTEYPEASSSDE